MRMRKKKNFEPRFALCRDMLIDDASAWQGKFRSFFGNENPLHLEIGCGRGGFIVQHAALHADVNYIGMERISNVLLLAMEKAKREGLANLRFLNLDARMLPELFAPGELDTIYLNFSDPWPKKGYEKNRLTHRNFLTLYHTALKEGGDLYFKTDNDGLFAFTQQELEGSDFSVVSVLEDLHADGAEGKIMTEYEQKFHAMGHPIHYLHAVNGARAAR